ncbi:MAG: DUF2726 domain-containing protein [Phycisphaerales bacterium]|nr:DUF2726 domain-containing protein [Phycisphaerales bacterium]
MSDAKESTQAGEDLSRKAGCLGFLARLLGAGAEKGERSAGRDETLPYRRKDWLLTKGEKAFYDVLCMAVNVNRHRIFCKVRLSDLLWLPKGAHEQQPHRNRIQSKHVDFVICSADALRPLLVIELDDRSHEREDRRQRDAFVDRALGAAGLPILHVPARAAYDAAQIEAEVGRALGG